MVELSHSEAVARLFQVRQDYMKLDAIHQETLAEMRTLLSSDLPRTHAFLRLAELWRDQLSLGTTQGGGRHYEEHCRQHEEARALLCEIDV